MYRFVSVFCVYVLCDGCLTLHPTQANSQVSWQRCSPPTGSRRCYSPSTTSATFSPSFGRYGTHGLRKYSHHTYVTFSTALPQLTDAELGALLVGLLDELKGASHTLRTRTHTGQRSSHSAILHRERLPQLHVRQRGGQLPPPSRGRHQGLLGAAASCSCHSCAVCVDVCVSCVYVSASVCCVSCILCLVLCVMCDV